MARPANWRPFGDLRPRRKGQDPTGAFPVGACHDNCRRRHADAGRRHKAVARDLARRDIDIRVPIEFVTIGLGWSVTVVVVPAPEPTWRDVVYGGMVIVVVGMETGGSTNTQGAVHWAVYVVKTSVPT